MALGEQGSLSPFMVFSIISFPFTKIAISKNEQAYIICCFFPSQELFSFCENCSQKTGTEQWHSWLVPWSGFWLHPDVGPVSLFWSLPRSFTALLSGCKWPSSVLNGNTSHPLCAGVNSCKIPGWEHGPLHPLATVLHHTCQSTVYQVQK